MHFHESTLNLLNLGHFPTDVDERFIDNFMELYLPAGYESLRQIAALSRQQINFTSEVLLAFYIQMVRRMAKHEGPTVFENGAVVEFLSIHEPTLVDGSSPLLHALYGLLADIESLEVRHPFKFDIDTMVYNALIAESTSISVRASVATLAIVRLENLFAAGRRPAASSSDDGGDGAARYLLWRLVDGLIDGDYAPVVDSLARVLQRFADRLLDGDGASAARLLQKAKQTSRVGLQFARLIAALCVSPRMRIQLDALTSGFCDAHTNALVLAEMFERNRDTHKFASAELADAIVNAAGNRLNFIAPVLSHVEFTSKEEAVWFLKRMLPSLRSSRFCSESAVGKFVAFVASIDANDFQLIPLVVESLVDRILLTPSLLKAFTTLLAPSFADLLTRTGLRAALSAAVRRQLIEHRQRQPNSTADHIDNGMDESAAEDEGRWEERDSALEIIAHCDARLLDCDVSLLIDCVFRLAAEDRSDFVRSTARRSLLRIYFPEVLTDGPLPEPSQSAPPLLTASQQASLTEMRDEAAREAAESRHAQTVHQTRRRALHAEIDDIIATLHNGCVLGDGVDDCVSKECY